MRPHEHRTQTELSALEADVREGLRSLPMKLLDPSSTHVRLSGDWSSTEPGYRSLIRTALADDLRARRIKFDAQSLSDLTRLPRVEGYGISISHTIGAGGYILARLLGADGIGFDIERKDRVRQELVARALAPGESLAVDRLSLQWCAKESVVKAFGNWSQQATPLIVDLPIEWTPAGGPLHFKVSHALGQATGTAFVSIRLSAAIAASAAESGS